MRVICEARNHILGFYCSCLHPTLKEAKLVPVSLANLGPVYSSNNSGVVPQVSNE